MRQERALMREGSGTNVDIPFLASVGRRSGRRGSRMLATTASAGTQAQEEGEGARPGLGWLRWRGRLVGSDPLVNSTTSPFFKSFLNMSPPH